jgi:hypothetical protein
LPEENLQARAAGLHLYFVKPRGIGLAVRDMRQFIILGGIPICLFHADL